MHEVKCPSCGQSISGRPASSRLQLCRSCGSGLPQRRRAVAIAGDVVFASGAPPSRPAPSPPSRGRPLETLDRGQLEVRFVAELLAHIDRRLENCGARLARLEAEVAAVTEAPGDGHEELAPGMRAEAAVLQGQIKRLDVATTLLQSYMQVRREQVAQLRAGQGESGELMS